MCFIITSCNVSRPNKSKINIDFRILSHDISSNKKVLTTVNYSWFTFDRSEIVITKYILIFLFFGLILSDCMALKILTYN